MQQDENKTKFWAIVELFGHSILAGEVSKCEIGDFIQLNIPQCDSVPPWSKIINPKAVYAITPVTEEVARARAETIKAMPVEAWDTEKFFQNRIKELADQGKIELIEKKE